MPKTVKLLRMVMLKNKMILKCNKCWVTTKQYLKIGYRGTAGRAQPTQKKERQGKILNYAILSLILHPF